MPVRYASRRFGKCCVTRASRARAETCSLFVAEVLVLQRRREMRAAALFTSPLSPWRMEADGLHGDAEAAHYGGQTARSGLLHHVDFVRAFAA